MSDDQQVAETPVAEANGSDEESELTSLLAEWDGRVSKSFEAPPPDAEFVPRDPEEIAAFQSRISTLETDNTALETDNAGLTERVEQVEGALDFVDENLTRIDQHDFDRAAETLSSELGINKRVVELELKQKLLDDPDFAALADARADSPEEFDSAMEQFSDELFDRHPPRVNDRGFAAAVRMSRSAHVGGGSYDENHYGNFSEMSDREFAVKSEEVFADMRSGKLRPDDGRQRGGCLRTGPW